MPILIDRFEGLVDFLSARDLTNQFQRLENMRINRVTRLVKRPGEAARTADNATALQVLPGMGHIQYRAERDESNVHVNSHFRTISLVDISGTPVVSIRRNNSINDDTGTFTEILGSTAWTLRQVVGSSNISFSGNEITKSSGLDVFFPGDLLRVYGSGEDNDGYVHVVSATATTVTVVEDLTTASNTSAVLIAFPHVSMYAINGVLRMSDGVFADTAPSQWYGHIKRDFWGQGITYGSNGGRFEQPAMSEAYNSYLLKAQELVAPTIIAGDRTAQGSSTTNPIAIHIAGAHHEFVELMPNSIDRTFAGGGTAWANVDLNAFNETADLTITATAKDQYCTCPVASMPMTAAGKYRLKFDVANLISTFTIQDFTGVQRFGAVRANGKEQSIKFTVDTAITGGLRLVADTDDASVDFDNWSLSSIEWPEKSIDTEWNERDRVTATYVYDFVQESELGKAASGEIGIPMGTIITEDIARAFMVEVYTGVAQAFWNRRITAIRLYYKFHDDPDWYEVVTLNINKGWSESEVVFDAENTGYWIPIVDQGGADHTGTIATGSDTTINDVAHGVDAADMLYVGNSRTIEPDSMITQPASVVADVITLPVAMVDSLGVNAASYALLTWFAGNVSTTAVATFYIPFTGEKAFSYFTNTGRAAKLKVPAIRWRAAATDGALTLVGNIDTKDENDQTVREHSRVIEMPAGMPDTALLKNSKDVGIFEGDEIMAHADYQNNWWVMKERNIHILQKGTLRTLGQFKGIGCRWMHSWVVTPWGLCVADESGIFLLPNRDELSFPIRATYQALTFFNPILTYSHLNKQLHFVPDTSSVTSAMLTFDLQNKGWMKDSFPAKTSLSNFAEGRHYEPEVMFEDGDPVLNLVTNSDAWTGATGATPPDDYSIVTWGAGGTFTISDLSGVANFDTDTLQIVAGGTLNLRIAHSISYFDDYSWKIGGIFKVTFAYRNDEGDFASKVTIGDTDGTDLTDTGLAGDAVLYSEEIIATSTTGIGLLYITVGKNGTLQIDNVIVRQLNSYHVKQLNKGTTDETGLIQTADIVLGNDPVLIRNAYITYLSSSVAVTVKVYLDNNALPAKTMPLDASSTLRNKVPILLNTTSEVLSLSFESTATDFTVEDIEIPDKEINPTD